MISDTFQILKIYNIVQKLVEHKLGMHVPVVIRQHFNVSDLIASIY